MKNNVIRATLSLSVVIQIKMDTHEITHCEVYLRSA